MHGRPQGARPACAYRCHMHYSGLHVRPRAPCCIRIPVGPAAPTQRGASLCQHDRRAYSALARPFAVHCSIDYPRGHERAGHTLSPVVVQPWLRNRRGMRHDHRRRRSGSSRRRGQQHKQSSRGKDGAPALALATGGSQSLSWRGVSGGPPSPAPPLRPGQRTKCKCTTSPSHAARPRHSKALQKAKRACKQHAYRQG